MKSWNLGILESWEADRQIDEGAMERWRGPIEPSMALHLGLCLNDGRWSLCFSSWLGFAGHWAWAEPVLLVANLSLGLSLVLSLPRVDGPLADKAADGSKHIPRTKSKLISLDN